VLQISEIHLNQKAASKKKCQPFLGIQKETYQNKKIFPKLVGPYTLFLKFSFYMTNFQKKKS